MLMSISELAEITGMDRRRITARLRNLPFEKGRGRAHRYETKSALAAIYGRADETLDPQQERARLDKARADLAEDQLRERRGDLIPAVDHHRVTAGFVKAAATLLDTLPDYLEREAGLSGAAVAVVVEKLDQFRDNAVNQLEEHLDNRRPENRSDASKTPRRSPSQGRRGTASATAH